jgi:hypothetical protein
MTVHPRAAPYIMHDGDPADFRSDRPVKLGPGVDPTTGKERDERIIRGDGPTIK